jgi:hypothetical protein
MPAFDKMRLASWKYAPASKYTGGDKHIYEYRCLIFLKKTLFYT